MPDSIRSSRLLVLSALLSSFVVASGEGRAQVLGALFGGQDDALFGDAIANVGDADGDGVDDVLVGEPNYTPDGVVFTGRVTLYSGATMAAIRTHEGSQSGDNWGDTVASAGDVDLDGFADYAVGAPRYTQNSITGAGMVTVYSGLAGNVLWTVYGTVKNGNLGNAIAGIGDVNGDFKADVLVGEPGRDTATVFDENGTPIFALSGTSGAGFGVGVGSIGDIDGDGRKDFAICAPFENVVVGGVTAFGAGVVHVYSSATTLELFETSGSNTGDMFGERVAAIGDVDGDQIPDLLVGSPWFQGGAGAFVVVSGANGGVIRGEYGGFPGNQVGASIVAIGDMNHDGVEDYAVGVPGFMVGSNYRGMVKACSGATGETLYEWDGSDSGRFPVHQNRSLGRAVAGGDFNLDGIGDVVFGDPEYKYEIKPVWHQSGAVYEYFGCPAFSENYGAGWPGKTGVPSFVAVDDPVPGRLITTSLGNSLGAATLGLLFVGIAQENVPTGKGGAFLVDPFFMAPLSIPSAGLQMTGTLPNDPALNFVNVYLQAIEADSSATKGISFTPGLRLHIGLDLP